MPNIVYNNRSIFFVHIPKTGGTSLYANLIAQGATVESYNPTIPVLEGVTSHHLDKEQISAYYGGGQNKFTIVRHPWHKTLSEYVYRTQDVEFENFHKWLKIQLTKYSRNKNILDNHLKPLSSFIDSDTKVFFFEKRDEMYSWINKKLDHTFDFKIKKNISPKYSITNKVHPETYALWLETYYKDLEFYNRLTNSSVDSII